jgi:hypothetical protein
MANQLLFDGRFRAGHLLDIGRHVERPDSIQRERVFLAPVKELVTGPCISTRVFRFPMVDVKNSV